jgi:hypothetical protein
MLELPDDPVNPLKLADWLEIYAILAPDRNSSRGDLERVLHRAALFELDDDEAIERMILDAFEEVEQRDRAASVAYPFDLNYRGILQLKSSWEDFPVYIFCLCLSYFPLRETNKAPKLFEKVSCLAAKSYLQGHSVGFGWPRTELSSSFPDAITELCNLMGEGAGYRQQSPLDRKDDTLDLVAWKDFTDKRSSKVLMFGQCAAGQHWEGKLGELQADTFCKQWMQFTPIHPPIRSFFIPHRVDRGEWDFLARKAGILFDRCRIAFWAHHEKVDYSNYVEWIRDLLAQVVS